MNSSPETLQRITALGAKESDFEERFARSSGPGGQNVNKVSTAVTVVHLPSGTTGVGRDTRSQSQNRQLAWERVLDNMEKERASKKQEIVDAREKEKRRKRPRPYGLQMRILEAKKRRSSVKKLRSSID